MKTLDRDLYRFPVTVLFAWQSNLGFIIAVSVPFRLWWRLKDVPAVTLIAETGLIIEWRSPSIITASPSAPVIDGADSHADEQISVLELMVDERPSVTIGEQPSVTIAEQPSAPQLTADDQPPVAIDEQPSAIMYRHPIGRHRGY